MGAIVRSGCLREPPAEVIAAYDAPFDIRESKAGAAQFPLIVPLTAKDAAWTINAGRALGLVPHVVRANATDPDTLVVRYRSPVGNVLAQLQQLPILPKHIWAHHAQSLASFANARRVVGPVVGPPTDHTGWVALEGLPAGETIAYRIRFERRREELERDRLTEGEVVGAIDLAHPTLPFALDDAVSAGEEGARLEAPVMIGVGAAFDFHAGLKKQAPSWMQKIGMEWFFRLVTEPDVAVQSG